MSPEPDQPDAVNDEDDGRVELRYATFDQIAEQIAKRTRSFIFVYIGSPDDEREAGGEVPTMQFGGYKTEQIGLLAWARRSLMQEID